MNNVQIMNKRGDSPWTKVTTITLDGATLPHISGLSGVYNAKEKELENSPETPELDRLFDGWEIRSSSKQLPIK